MYRVKKSVRITMNRPIAIVQVAAVIGGTLKTATDSLKWYGNLTSYQDGHKNLSIAFPIIWAIVSNRSV